MGNQSSSLFPSVDTTADPTQPISKPPASVVTANVDEPLLNESYSPSDMFSAGGITGGKKTVEPSRFFPYEVKNDEVARYADGVNQVGNLRKIRK